MKVYTLNYNFLYKDDGLDFHWWQNKPTNAHSHTFYEFFILTKDKTVHKLNGETKELPHGTLCFIPPKIPHEFPTTKNASYEHINVSVTTNRLKKLCDAILPNLFDTIKDTCFEIVLSQKQFDYFYDKAKSISNASIQNDSLDKISICEMITSAVSIIYKKITNKVDNRPEWFNNFLGKINSVDFSLTTINNIYELSNYSPATIIKYFKKYTGETIVSYLCKIKINRACNLLATTDFTVLNIATSLGYDSLSHFNRIFKSHTGQTPSQFREQCKNIK